MLNNREEQALTATSAAYGALCRSVARNILGNDEDAEECLNDALLRIWNSIPPAEPENYCAYVLKTVRNTALSRRRDRNNAKHGFGQYTQTLEELTEVLPASGSVERELEQRELLAAVTAFLRKLPEKQRNLFICRYWQSASLTELAAQFAMPESTVKVTLGRLRRRLQKYLRGEGLL